MKRLFTVIALLLLVLSAWSAKPAWAQKTSIQLDSDIRIFTMLAALHQAGLRFEDARFHPVQSAISREFNELPQALREKMQNFIPGAYLRAQARRAHEPLYLVGFAL